MKNTKNSLINLDGNMKAYKVLKSNKFILIFCFGLVLGLILSMSFRAIKYNQILDPKIVNIDPTDAYDQIINTKNKVIFIDVRSRSEYDKAHASSSINLPIHYLYDDTHGFKNELKVPLPKNTNQDIYLICSGGRLAGVAYSYLEHYGYRNIKRIDGGISNWAKQGLPVISQSLFKSGEIEFNPNSELDKPYVKTN